MIKMGRIFLLAVLLTLLFSVNVTAKTEYSIKEVKEKIGKGQVSSIWLTDEGIEGIEVDTKYGLAKEEFVVTGEYNKIPYDFRKQAFLKRVKIKPSKRSADLAKEPLQFMQIFGMAVLFLSIFIIIVMLILIHSKVAKLLLLHEKK